MRPLRLALTAVMLAAMIVPTVLPISGGAAVGSAVARLSASGTDRAAGSAVQTKRALRIADQQPFDAVLRSIRERFPGRALEARQIERDGRAVYRIKWLGDDGKVRDILADAATGAIVRVR
jgi:uncharacterized membrane protein YkoI